CGCKLEFHRVLALRSAAASADRGDDCNLFHRHLCSRGSCWPCNGHCRLPALSDNKRRSIQPAQRIAEIDEANGQRPTLNAQHSSLKLFCVGSWGLDACLRSIEVER